MEPIQQLEAWQQQVANNPAADAADIGVAKRLITHGIQATTEIKRLREAMARALERGKVFDDGSDGADGESAQSVVGILSAALDA